MIELLNQWLPIFIVETHKEDSGRYPVSTITQLLAGLWQAARTNSPERLNFMNRKNYRFAELNDTLQSMWYLSSLAI